MLGPPLWQGLMAWPLFEHCRGSVLGSLVWLSGRAFPSMARGGPSVHGGVHYGLLRSLGAPILGTVSGTGCRHCAVHPSGRLSMEIAICIRYAVVVVRA